MAGKKAKVLERLSNAIQSIASLPKAQRVLLERTAEAKTYFLAKMNEPTVTTRSSQAELKRLAETVWSRPQRYSTVSSTFKLLSRVIMTGMLHGTSC